MNPRYCLLGAPCKLMSIDVSAWDNRKDKVMKAILLQFATQHEHVKEALTGNDLETLTDDTMPDPYWPTKLPTMWREVKAQLV